MFGRACLIALLLIAPCEMAPREARAANVKRVAVRVTEATSRALMQRVRGQTSDLDLELVEATEPEMEARVGDEVATAGRLAERLDARIVVWFEEGAQGLTLFFCIPDEQRTLVRTLAGGLDGRGARAQPASKLRRWSCARSYAHWRPARRSESRWRLLSTFLSLSPSRNPPSPCRARPEA